MGCVITGNQKVNPSILEDNIRKCKHQVASVASLKESKRNKRPTIEVPEARIEGSSCLTVSQKPRTESEIDQNQRKDPSKFYICQNSSRESYRSIKHKASMESERAKTDENQYPASNSNPRILLTGSETFTKNESKVPISLYEKPLICSMGSTAHFGTSELEIHENNSNFHRHQTKPPSVGEIPMGSNLLTISKHESTKSMTYWPAQEERASIEELMPTTINNNTKINERKTPSLGAVDAVEEVSASREINLKSGDDVCSIEAENANPNIPSLNNLDGSSTISPPRIKEWEMNMIAESPAFKEAKPFERQVLGEKNNNLTNMGSSVFAELNRGMNVSKLEGTAIGSQFMLYSFANIPQEQQNNNNNNNPITIIENTTNEKKEALVSKQQQQQQQQKKEEVKAQAKAKFARNLLDLVQPNKENKAEKAPINNKEIKEVVKEVIKEESICVSDKLGGHLSPVRPFSPEERSDSLSLLNCLPDEVDVNKPQLLDLEMFGDAEGLSPINAIKGAQGDFTPFMSVAGSTFRKRDSPSTFLEDRTITNIEDNISKFDIDKYSFTAEVKKIEIDEQNNYNVYKSPKGAIPHQPAKKSAFGLKPLMSMGSQFEAREKSFGGDSSKAGENDTPSAKRLMQKYNNKPASLRESSS